ncbi:hypothetical protein ACOZ4N_14770 [Halorientalis pallida]|uniref:hypothetical protein n=1 Tax=Halorientalis pallida TaxID=2479928 RepID=UPI003C6EC40B
MERHSRILFREPNGPRRGFIFLSLSVVALLAWLYFGARLDGLSILLFQATAFASLGVAESLPPNRRRVAGVLRILAVAIMVIYLVVLAAAPDLFLD